jgi:sulfur carrier protein ThiS
MKIKLVQIPGGVTEVEIEPGQTVAQVLEGADIDPEGYSLMVRGQEVGLDTPIQEEGVKIILAEDIEGN